VSEKKADQVQSDQPASQRIDPQTKKAARSGNPAKSAAAQKDIQQRRDAAAQRRRQAAASRDWVPWVFVPLGLLGILWLVVFYIAGYEIPFMAALGNWNFAIGLGLMAASFIVAMFWK